MFFFRLCFLKSFRSCLSLFATSFFCLHSFAQTPLPVLQSPVNGNYTLNGNPQFSAILNGFSSDRTFNVAISESPRSGASNQYTLFWVKNNVYPSQLLESYNNLLKWDSSWIKKTRNGNPDATAQIVSNSSPASLVEGKKYYWHVVTSDGFYKSAESSFVIGPKPPVFFCNSYNLPQGLVVTGVEYQSYSCGSTYAPPNRDNGYYAQPPRDHLNICLTNYSYSYDLGIELNYGPPPSGFVFTRYNGSAGCVNWYDAYGKAHGVSLEISTPYDGQGICSYESPAKAPPGFYISSNWNDYGMTCGGRTRNNMNGNQVYTIRKIQ